MSGSPDLLNCPGCGEPPMRVGNMGRHKYACPLYTARSKRTTQACAGNMEGPMWMQDADARSCWNLHVSSE